MDSPNAERPAPSSQDAEDSTSDSSSQAGAPNGPANPTSTAEPSSNATTPDDPPTPTYATSTTSPESTSLQADSPARTSPTPDQEQGWPATGPDFGSRWQTRCARFNPDSSSSKTSPASSPRWVSDQESLLSEPSSPTWPKQGTWGLGSAFELPTSVHPIYASESSSSDDALLPTPTATYPGGSEEEFLNRKGRLPGGAIHPGRKWHAQRTLSRMAPALLPTPSANDSTGGESKERRQSSEEQAGPMLRDLGHLLPTPTNRDFKGRSGPNADSPESILANVEMLLPTPTAGDGEAAGSRNLEGSKAHAGVSLTDAVMHGNSTTPRRLPTPGARDWKGRNQRDDDSFLPGALTGARTGRPSDAGNSSADDPPPDQLTIGDA